MKIIQLFTGVFGFLFMLPTFALTGLQVGGQVGEGNSHYTTSKVGLISSAPHYQGVSGRVFIGYAFKPFINLELGYLKIRRTRFVGMNGTSTVGKVTQASYDLLMRADFPLPNGYEVFVRTGLARVCAEPNAALRSFSSNDYSRDTVAHFRPVVGAGGAYKINDSLTLEAAWMRTIQHRAIPRVDFISFGVRYNLPI